MFYEFTSTNTIANVIILNTQDVKEIVITFQLRKIVIPFVEIIKVSDFMLSVRTKKILSVLVLDFNMKKKKNIFSSVHANRMKQGELKANLSALMKNFKVSLSSVLSYHIPIQEQHRRKAKRAQFDDTSGILKNISSHV